MFQHDGCSAKQSTSKSLSLITIALALYIAIYPPCIVALNTSKSQFTKRNDTVFQYHDIRDCTINEFYDFNYFDCVPCSSGGSSSDSSAKEQLHLRLIQPTADKLDCECANRNAATTLNYNIGSGGGGGGGNEEQPQCGDFCTTFNGATANDDRTAQQPTAVASCLPLSVVNAFSGGGCRFKYVNITKADSFNAGAGVGFGDGGEQRVRITNFEPRIDDDGEDAGGDGNCDSCDLRYNFHYQDYCIVNALMKPYLRYSAFGQTLASAAAAAAGGGSVAPTAAPHFGELKFVAFFCLTLRNATACQQLANLCVLSHYAPDRNSPCSAFLLAQASDETAMTYASSDADDVRLRSLRPFLFYRRGKATAQLLTAPLKASQLYRHDDDQHDEARVRLVSTTHRLDGRLRRWGALKLSTQLDLCRTPRSHALPWADIDGDGDGGGGVPFANRDRRLEVVLSACELSLEQLLDAAQLAANDNFISVYLNYSSDDTATTLNAAGTRSETRFHLQAVPVLIEDLVPANRHAALRAEWQLVKRFQMIATQPLHSSHRHQRLHQPQPALAFTDASKMQVYRSVRYASHVQLHYRVHVQEQQQQRISLPLLRLRYRNVQLQPNMSLHEPQPFELRVSYELVDGAPSTAFVSSTALPVLLIGAVAAAALHAYGCHRRRHTVAAAKQHTAATMSAVDLCDFACIGEFLLHCVSHVADALLIAYLLFVFGSAFRYYTTQSLLVSLPLAQTQGDAALGALMYVALALKCSFLVVHGWRISHCDVFFVDWERPRNYDTTHFNLKSSNLETSSMCSSVRTFVTECNVSAWRIFYTANEWIRMSARPRVSSVLQCLALLLTFQLFDVQRLTHGDHVLRVAGIALCYCVTHLLQLLLGSCVLPAFCGHSLRNFLDLCSLANVSVFTMLESAAFGFYVHGRSPHGFADTDMSSMLVQLQRETQNMCGRRGLLSDSDHQMYLIVPPTNLRTYFDRLLVPFQRSFSVSQAHFHKTETSSCGSSAEHAALERTTVAYSSVNRFFCAFIDHAIRDMDYIIKEKSLMDKLFNCEFDNYLTENRGTFYIDQSYSFTRLFLHGNHMHIFTFELLLIICLYTSAVPLHVILLLVYVINMLIQMVFRIWVRQNVAMKTLIDKRFLIL